MRIADLNSGSIQIQRATRKLKDKWTDTKSEWQDKTGEDFEKKYLRPLGESVSYTVTAVRRMMKLLEQAERECEDEQQ